MPTTTSSPGGPAAPAAPTNRELDAERHRLLLSQLADIGMTIAHAIGQAASAHAAATAAAINEPAPDAAILPKLAAAYDRVARSVRRTVMLSEQLGKPEPAPRQARTAARKRIIREVEQAIERRTGQGDNADTPESLRAELTERLDSPDFDDDLADRPVADIIIDIVRDLGLGNGYSLTWKRRTPADLRALDEQAARPRPAPSPHHRPPQPPDPAGSNLPLGAAQLLLQTASSPNR